jgi:hypothetical protein
MSLEDALNANTKAVQEHTAQLKLMLSGAKPPAAGASKPADKPPSKPADKAPAKTSTTKTKGEPTVADVTERVTNFMKVSDKDVRDERKAQVKTIIDHYGADRFTNIDPSKFAEALSFLKAYEDGEEPDFGDDGGDEEGDGDDDMV